MRNKTKLYGKKKFKEKKRIKKNKGNRSGKVTERDTGYHPFGNGICYH